MPRGKVIFYNIKSKFGFIKCHDTDENYYVNGKNLLDVLKEGDEVLFELKDAKRGKEAIHVKKTD